MGSSALVRDQGRQQTLSWFEIQPRLGRKEPQPAQYGTMLDFSLGLVLPFPR